MMKTSECLRSISTLKKYTPTPPPPPFKCDCRFLFLCCMHDKLTINDMMEGIIR